MKKTLITITLFAFCFAGCAMPEMPIPKSLKEARQDFIEICKKDYKISPHVKVLNNIIYVYVPIDYEIFEYKASPSIARMLDKKRKDKFQINLIETEILDNSCNINYDIIPSRAYPDDKGFKSSYTEPFRNVQNNISRAVFRAFGDTKMMPEFFNIIIANVKKGIEVRSLFYFEDFKSANNGALPHDEYLKRYISEIKGREETIGDSTGKSIDYHEISWDQFLGMQLKTRIKFKFTQSDFPPKGEKEDALLNIVGEMCATYEDKCSFKTIRLNDFAEEKTLKIEFKTN